MIYTELWSCAIAARCPLPTSLPWCTVLSSLFTIIDRYSSQIHVLKAKLNYINEIVTYCKAQSFANYTVFFCTGWNLWCCGLCGQKSPKIQAPESGKIISLTCSFKFLRATVRLMPLANHGNVRVLQGQLRTATRLDCERGQYPHHDDDTVVVVVVVVVVMTLLSWLLLLSSSFLHSR